MANRRFEGVSEVDGSQSPFSFIKQEPTNPPCPTGPIRREPPPFDQEPEYEELVERVKELEFKLQQLINSLEKLSKVLDGYRFSVDQNLALRRG